MHLKCNVFAFYTISAEYTYEILKFYTYIQQIWYKMQKIAVTNFSATN